MSIWLCTPSARPNGGTAALWRERGYKIGLWRDPGQETDYADLNLVGEYPGHSLATNAVIKEVLRMDPDAQWVINAGDDTDPDPLYPQEIARECTEYFDGTYGVMQPCGDSWADYSIERICGSPWLGREFCERFNGGLGPFWSEYFHMFADEEMNCITKQLGILWQRRDVTHMHHHWQRESGIAPAFLARANSRQNWDAMQALFNARKRAGFPGHQPLPVRATVTA